MALKLEEKKTIVAEVAAVAGEALSIVAADYRGLTSAEMTELRKRARAVKVCLRVVRNTLARRAFEQTQYAGMAEVFSGPLLLAFTSEEPGATAKLLRDFAKDHNKLEVLTLSLNGVVLDKSQLDKVASLPTKDEAIAKLLSVMQAPITKLVRTMAEPHAKLVRTLAAIRSQKEVG